MSKNFEPPGPRLENVEIVISLVDGGEKRIDGHAAADILAEYRKLVAQGLEGWRLIHELLGDDWGPPPIYVRILVNGEMVATIPYDRPRRSRR
jgi:hypothetical protein